MSHLSELSTEMLRSSTERGKTPVCGSNNICVYNPPEPLHAEYSAHFHFNSRVNNILCTLTYFYISCMNMITPKEY